MTADDFFEGQEELKDNLILTTVDAVYNWGRKGSVWPVFFGLACCAIEMISAASARYDFSRFGMEIMRASPRQADLLIVAGTVTHKMAPAVKRIYEQMPEPKYVLAMGACATDGGPFPGYSVLQGVDEIVPVDVYVPGCPVRPEALIHGFMMLHDKIEGQSIRTAPWYQKDGEAV